MAYRYKCFIVDAADEQYKGTIILDLPLAASRARHEAEYGWTLVDNNIINGYTSGQCYGRMIAQWQPVDILCDMVYNGKYFSVIGLYGMFSATLGMYNNRGDGRVAKFAHKLGGYDDGSNRLIRWSMGDAGAVE